MLDYNPGATSVEVSLKRDIRDDEEVVEITLYKQVVGSLRNQFKAVSIYRGANQGFVSC